MAKQDKEARELAKKITPIIAGQRLGVILKAFQMLQDVLISRAVLGDNNEH